MVVTSAVTIIERHEEGSLLGEGFALEESSLLVEASLFVSFSCMTISFRFWVQQRSEDWEPQKPNHRRLSNIRVITSCQYLYCLPPPRHPLKQFL